MTQDTQEVTQDTQEVTHEEVTQDTTHEEVTQEVRDGKELDSAVCKVLKALEQGGETARRLQTKFLPYILQQQQFQTLGVQTETATVLTSEAQTDSVSIRAPVAVHTSEAQTDSISMNQKPHVRKKRQYKKVVQETPFQPTPAQETSVQETSIQERSFQTTIMEGMYWYVKQKNTGTFINRTYPGNRTVPNLAKTFDEEFSGRNIVIVDVVGNIRSYTLEDLVSVQRELDKRVHQTFQRRTTIVTPVEQTSATQPTTTETSTTLEPRPTLARPKKRRRGIHRPRFGICSVSGCNRRRPSGSSMFCLDCGMLRQDKDD